MLSSALCVNMKNQMYVYIAISDLNIHPDEITSMLKVKPTKIDIKGDLVGKTKIRCKSNRWEYRITAGKRFELDYLVNKLLNKFKDTKSLKKAIGKGKGHITCVFWSSDRLPSIEMSAKTLSRIADLNCDFWVDYYTS